ncbi:MAG: helix-turn-helix transcriptional regulator [Clostridiales bacterium]|nr:helix-turn-helix transcriptional regulator [Clostridiales bacterium]
MWLMLTIFLSVEHFYTLKWLLLVTDIILIVLALAISVGHVLFAAAAKERMDLYYMIIVTAMLIWNYVSYFWGDTSVYWGNSSFIRAPLDLTIIFWLVINVTTLFYEYKYDFLPTFFGKTTNEPEGKSDIKVRIDEVCVQYKLTPREKEFIELIYSGKSNKEIAEVLFLSESTVKTHIYNIFRKMDAKNRVGVICIINEEKIEPDEE